jgi:hypothetical protein
MRSITNPSASITRVPGLPPRLVPRMQHRHLHAGQVDAIARLHFAHVQPSISAAAPTGGVGRPGRSQRRPVEVIVVDGRSARRRSAAGRPAAASAGRRWAMRAQHRIGQQPHAADLGRTVA